MSFGVRVIGLTKRELQIAALVCQGIANKEIAGRLGVCEGTVKSHLHAIYRKLRVRNRSELIIAFWGQQKARRSLTSEQGDETPAQVANIEHHSKAGKR